jgi:shikimate kinase
MNIILFGFKGSGKTYLGKRCSAALGCPFIDTDELIEKMYASRISLREIYKIEGEANFRMLERAAILSLPSKPPSIIATGGGAVLNPENVQDLQKIGKLVYLKASFDTIKKRLTTTPAFVDKANSLEAIYRKRLPIYESIPAIALDVDLCDEVECIAKLRMAYGF